MGVPIGKPPAGERTVESPVRSSTTAPVLLNVALTVSIVTLPPSVTIGVKVNGNSESGIWAEADLVRVVDRHPPD